MKPIRRFSAKSEEQELLEKVIIEQAAGSQINILEAGCGNRWPLTLNGIEYVLTGLDIDKRALEIRKKRFDDLDEIIEGDLRYVDLGNTKYDIIYCSFVLEHVDNAKLVLNNFSSWLKPGGLLLLKIPERNSVYGFITRVTPLWFHIFYKRYLRGTKNAGRPGHGPYPTYHDPVISRVGIHKFCSNNSFLIREEYAQNFDLDRAGTTAKLERLFVRAIRVLSFGNLISEYNGLTFVLQRLPNRD